MDLSKYNRAFFFGCSFTHYYWPTWADILSKEIKKTYVYAKVGAGNFFIYQALIEAIVKHDIQEDDLVIVMLSNVTREDRYTEKEGWITPGNLFFQDVYDKKFLEKFFCQKGYLLRDLNLIEGMIRSLKTTSADFYFTSIVPVDSLSSDSVKMKDVQTILDSYRRTISQIKPSVLDVVFNGNWNNRTARPVYNTHWSKDLYTDNHPTPQEHLEYILSIFPEIKISSRTKDYVKDATQRLLSCSTYTEIVNTFKHELTVPEARIQ